MKNIPVDEMFKTSVRVHVNDAGAATSAAVESPSGRPAFDRAVLTAARRATYPLDGSNCKPLPNEYVWSATFGYHAFPSAYPTFGNGIRHKGKAR
jgi:TonB family protein